MAGELALRRRSRASRSFGFTLMETLVMLVLVSLSVLLMFQMLGAYRIARERAAAQAGDIDRQALFDAWFLESVRGLHALEDAPLEGGASGFSAVTLNPLYGSPGAPTPISWELVAQAGADTMVRYHEDGEQRWQLPLRDGQPGRFAFVDSQGGLHDSWPPEQGMQDALPASVALLSGAGTEARLRLASVRGPLQPQVVPFQLEQE
ncbi:hypothetical protein [Lysobacter sp. D1-1-M9]|uniref:hypothetical protein n=1 Tax=Novilysobacter longmucuonensis TaxID=3098603 RepID=UPI002FC7CBB5